MEHHDALQLAASDGLQLGQPQPGLEVAHQTFQPNGEFYHDCKDSVDVNTHERQQPASMLFGLRPATFWLALSLGVMIVIAAVVGGVVGAIAAKNSSRPSTPSAPAAQVSTSAPSATVTIMPARFECASTVTSQPSAAATALLNFSPPRPANVTTLALDCNTLNNTLTRVLDPGIDAWFEVKCSNDQRGSGPAANNAGTIKDILPLTTYTIEDCMLACAAWNAISRSIVCRGVTFGQNMSENWREHRSNCWLKNATGPGVYQESVASALLQ